ncbi:MAG: ATP-binding cassette domain-containing protein [Thermoplasmata archaeon]|nr:ATP-binding cassette domain-containing protein [Thermoplasmata archaeon]
MIHGLRAENICKRLDCNQVLDNVSFSAKPGKIMAIIGGSGSGKTTLLKTINRLIEIDSGDIYLNDKSIITIDPIELRRRAGLVLQIPTMLDGTVKQNIEFGLYLRKIDQINKLKIMQGAKDSGLTERFLNKNANKLSVGEQQRVALARTLVLEPEVLLLDEPTASLDPKLTRKIESTILRLCKSRNLITLWVTHDHAQARRVGDQVGILKNGSIKLLQKVETRKIKLARKNNNYSGGD